MPFKSKSQEKLMQGVAHNPEFAKKVGIPQSVGKKFIKHSKDESPEEPTPLSTPEFIEDESLELDETKHELASIRQEIEAISRKILGVKVDNYLQKAMESDLRVANSETVPRFGADSELWQTKKGENKNGGLNEKGRENYNKSHHAHLKAPQPEGGSRKSSFCARMKGMKAKLTSEKTAHDPDSRINKSLRKWKCDADEVKNELSNIVDALIDYAESIPDEDPCWQDYHQIGMKEKDGRKVPNCVADSVTQLSDIHGIELPVSESKPVAKDAGAKGRASGILFLTDEGEILMIRRGDGGDYPRTWAVPGGHQEPNESLEDGARRECFEEVGIDYEGKLEVLHDDGQFCTYIARNFKKCKVILNDESTGYDWCPVGEPPMPLHPGQQIAMQVANIKTEYDVAELIQSNVLPSPQMYANIMLIAIRITGTGLAYRGSINEYVWRDSSLYLNDEFLKRCNGLMVIMDHPESAVLNGKEFKDRAVGSIMLPYIKGDEVWGIAKIYDQDAIDEICEGEISTSPSVVFDNTAGNTTLTTENGDPLLIEGVPFLLDHIAIVTKARGSKGVWDKGGEPAGVLLTNPEVSNYE